METNISTDSTADIARLFQALSQAARVQILLAINTDEACVCHLEAALGMRQAAISQHLMVLKDAGLVKAEREGRNIYYRLAQPGLLAFVQQAAAMAGMERVEPIPPAPNCPCPRCEANATIRCC